jgi:signal transduction histidine kinase/CheY-like chemotaxis protein
METGTAPTLDADALVRAESIKQLFQQPFLAFMVGVIVAVTFTAYLFRNHAGAGEVTFWLVWMYVLASLRIFLILAYRKAAPPAGRAQRWMLGYAVAITLFSAGWGMPAFYLRADDPQLVFFYTMIVSALVAGGVPLLSYHFPTYVSISLFCATPFTVQLFRFGTTYYAIFGALTILFVITNMASARNMRNGTYARIRLEFENRVLLRNMLKAKEEAEHANLVKTKFLAAASHDLRQPLHALGLFVDLLDARIQFPEVRRIVDNIKLSTQSLKGLLNSLLDISKLDAGVLKPEVASFSLHALLEQLALEYGPQAEGAGLTLRIRPCDAWVSSDPIMLARILRNMLSNAIRYTRTGGVLLGCRRRQGQIRIEVHDTGLGIPADQTGRIFTEFYQVDNHGHQRGTGLGLGLAIVKRLADLLHHPIDVTSRPGHGSMFSITVPTATPVPTQQIAPTIYRDDLAEAIIVVIDDEAPIREGMGEVLQDWGCRAVLAESADEAMQQLANINAIPDIVIADYQLREGRTGVQAIRQICAALGRDIPAVIVTGDIASERLAEVHASGYQLLHKPVSAARLRSLTSYLLDKATPQGGS